MTLRHSQCAWCKHLLPKINHPSDSTCLAFPEGIPPEVLWNKFDHKQSYPGDNGIQFEAKEEDTSPIPETMEFSLKRKRKKRRK